MTKFGDEFSKLHTSEAASIQSMKDSSLSECQELLPRKEDVFAEFMDRFNYKEAKDAVWLHPAGVEDEKELPKYKFLEKNIDKKKGIQI